MSVVPQLKGFLLGHDRLCVVKAPPGSGKSFNLVQTLAAVVDTDLRVVVAAQTNNQVDDLCAQIANAYPTTRVVRFSSGRYSGAVASNVEILSKVDQLPVGPSIVVGTVSKLAISTFDQSYDVLFVDEAWQMTWADLLTLRDVSARYVLIGDPGQIPPVVTIDVDRWEVSPVAPHRPAPDVILRNPELRNITTVLELQCVYAADDGEADTPRDLTPADIGIVSTHNLMNTAIENALPAALRGTKGIRVTTPERWQGLQKPVMIAVHPLSGIASPSSFDLETGRLCVMASRHRSACFFVTRDNVGRTLDVHLPNADQALGCHDIVGRGHAQHTAFWKYHEERDLVV